MSETSMWRQPRPVWAVAFASVIAFMGIGLVDPILKPIADDLGASPSQVSLLFTSYMAVMGVAMLITGVVSSRIGAKRTLLAGLAIIVVGSALAGMQDASTASSMFRAVWGLGNALFVATALATIVRSARGSTAQAIILYEAALGVGIATGPLIGGLLGELSWRWAVLRRGRPHGHRPRAHVRHAARDPSRVEAHEPRGPVPCAQAPRAARRRDHGHALQLRVLHAARVHAVRPRDGRDPDRPDLLRLGPAAGHLVGLRRSAPAAPLRHPAVGVLRDDGVRRDPRGDGCRSPSRSRS